LKKEALGLRWGCIRCKGDISSIS